MRTWAAGGVALALVGCSGTNVSLGIQPTLTGGPYLVTSGGVLAPNSCNIGSFYASISTGSVAVPGKRGASSVDITEGGYGPYTYDIHEETLSDLPDSTSAAVLNCSVQNPFSPGYTQCGTVNNYACKMIFTQQFLGSITAENRFTLTDLYVYSQGSPGCPPAVVGSAHGSGVTLPCSSVDSGDFVRR